MKRTICRAGLLGLAVLTPAVVQAGGQAREQAGAVMADTVFANGRVYVDVMTQTAVEAVAVREGKIVATGTTAAMKALAGSQANVIDLGGRAMLPGFYDNHIHLGSDGDPRVQDWEAVSAKAELLEKLAGMAAKLPKGEWILASLANETMPQEKLPTRWEMDKVTPDHPVSMRRGHITLANSLAMKLANVTDATPAPPGGGIDRDDKGRSIGWFREGSGRRMIMKAVPPPPPPPDETAMAELRTQLTKLLPLGITSINVAGMRPADMRLLQATYETWGAELPRTTVQLRLWPGYDAYDDAIEGADASIREMEALGFRTGYGTDRLKIGAIKTSIDGGFSAAAFWTIEPYPGHPEEHGVVRIPREAFYRLARKAHDLGWQLGTHAIGDGAVEMVAGVYRQILEEAPRKNHRHFIHHFSVMPPEATLDIMAKYDILVASQPNFTYSLGPNNAAPALSPERLATNNPQQTLIKRGIKLSYGSDGMPTDPRVGIYAAVTRKGEDGKVYGPQEAVSLPDAIRMYTQAPAYLNFLENERGSIAPGKVADFVVLGRDIYKAGGEALMSLPIDMTIVGGKIVYSHTHQPAGPH